ncbi:hypothetical protein BIW11_13096 [Tropilaelaps mercedesae]|uniref:E3 ubiquitin-protein ligase APD1-4 middle domain-containing protein n=1 Tax=Tropilaelaps mercedesae TaxID=418985 RepID=A0A1V9X3S5_9ACAR|nr:hypothetical protein BIW11_13096 [Tropilaelaps mercedesae]
MEEPRATSFCVRMWLITMTLVICLICSCFVMVKAPETKVEVSSTDMRLLDGVSGLWCQGQELVSTHKFNVYRFNDDGRQHNQTKTRTETDHVLMRLHVGPRKHQYLRYFLLSGSAVSVSAVSEKPRGTTEVSATEDDHYYILVVNDSDEHDISVTLRVSLTRIRFLVEHDDIVCNKVKHCLHHIGFGTEARLVLDIPREPDAGRSMYIVRSVCRPRIFFYALLFILIPIIVLLITSFIIKAYSTLLTLPHHNRTDLRSRIVRHIQTQSSVDRRAREVLTSSTSAESGPVLRPYVPPRQCVQVLYQIPGDQGLLDRVPTPGTPPPSYASLEESRKLTPLVGCERCNNKSEVKPLLLQPPTKYPDAE